MKNVNDFSLSERKDYLAPECEIIEVQGSNFCWMPVVMTITLVQNTVVLKTVTKWIGNL